MFCEECGAPIDAGTTCPRCGAGSAGGRRRVVIRLGRAPDNDVVVDSPSVSRYHAEIRREGDGRVILVDLESQGGTFLKGKRVERAEMAPADGIALGRSAVAPAVLAPLLAQLHTAVSSRQAPGSSDAAPGAAAHHELALGQPHVRLARPTLWTRITTASSPGGVVTFGVFNIVFGALGLVLPVLLWTVWRIDEAGGSGEPTLLVAALGLAVHQMVLFIGGVGLVLRRRWGRIVSLIWAGISCVALVAAGVSAAVVEGPLGGSEIGAAAALVGCIVLMAYPALLLLLLNVSSYRQALHGGRPGRGPTPAGSGESRFDGQGGQQREIAPTGGLDRGAARRILDCRPSPARPAVTHGVRG
ncbi:MAG: FHA domain-containing protein [Deltaproteobacteria bacterium]|nr:FHA domain-containing protein [Deltaproteobacteria bacterium]